jgi:PII-like signaling protein
VSGDCLKLTAYFGERDRVAGGFLADAIAAIHARHDVHTSVLLRGVEGFGAGQRTRTDSLLTLSEDLPMVSVAVDTPARIEAARGEIEALGFGGLLTVERARLIDGAGGYVPAIAGDGDRDGGAGEGAGDGDRDGADGVKLTIFVGRHQRADRRPAHEVAVALLRGCGVAGATVLLGVDGTVRGERERARFFAANARVPAIVVAVGDGESIGRALAQLAGPLGQCPMTVERVRLCRRDGQALAQPQQPPDHGLSGRQLWQLLTVYAGEQSRSDGHPIHRQLTRQLRAAGAAGVTTVRGVWGYHGDHQPHGDSLWRLRRRVPVVTVCIDTPTRSREWMALIAAVTAQTGLVTSELVPAVAVVGGDGVATGLRPAPPHSGSAG